MSTMSTKLPVACAARNPTNNKPIIIKRGERGYFPAAEDLNIQMFNRRLNVTAAQVEAMLVGSMFGFDVPGADPDRCSGTAEADLV